MSIRRYTGRSRSRRSNPVGGWRRNPTPLKPKQFKKRLEQLGKLGLDDSGLIQVFGNLREELKSLLSDADSSHATYVFDFWQARLALLRLVDEEAPPERQMEGRLVDLIQKWANKYSVSIYNCTLDEELQIDYYESLKHFIHLAANNQYFAESWAPLHRVTFIVPPINRWRDEERHIWLGRKQGKTRLSNSMYGLQGYAHDHNLRNRAAPAIKLLRGAYSGDPIGAARETEIPIELIDRDEKVMAPSDLIEYLTDMEANTVSAKFFVPNYHDPLMTFDDGKSWVIIHRDDKSSESRSLSDCGSGQYSSQSIVLLSLREPIPGTNPKQYKALLKAEVVFPSGTIGMDEYMDYRDLEGKVGVINQLRAHHNSKPGTKGSGHYQIIDRSLHNYIIPLLELPWVAHFSRPTHRSDDIFWPSDLTTRQIEYLKEKNEYLFDTQKFYERFKELDYPSRLRNTLTEGLEFPLPYVTEVLSSITPRMVRVGTIEASMVRASLKRAERAREQGDISEELLSLMDAAEARILGIERGRLDVVDTPLGTGPELSWGEQSIGEWLIERGAEISYQEIYRIFMMALNQEHLESPGWAVADSAVAARQERTSREAEFFDDRWYPKNWRIAVESLAKKIERDDPDVAPLKRLGSRLVAAGFDWGLVRAGITLNINQLKRVIETKLVDATEALTTLADDYEDYERPIRGFFFPVASWNTILWNLRLISGSYMSQIASTTTALSRALAIPGGPAWTSSTEAIMQMPAGSFHTSPEATEESLELLGDPWSNPYAETLEPVAPLLRDLIIFSLRNRKFRNKNKQLIHNIIALPFSLSEKDIIDILKGAYETATYSYSFGGLKISFHTRKGFNAQHIPVYRAALTSLSRKLDAPTRRSKKRLLAVAKKFLLAIEDESLAQEVANIIELPMRNIIQIISARPGRYAHYIRDSALAALKKKINRGDRALRREALLAIKRVLKDQNFFNTAFVTNIFNTYDGHKSRYELLYFLAIERISWISRDQDFFVRIIELGLPSEDGTTYRNSPRALPRSMYLLFRRLILEQPKSYLALIVKLLFRLRFNKESLIAVRRLIELALDKIIDDPNLLVSSSAHPNSSNDLCYWIKESRYGQPNRLKLTPKLLQQFRTLRNITLTIEDKNVKVADLTEKEIARFQEHGAIGERGTTVISGGARKFIWKSNKDAHTEGRVDYDRASARSRCFLDLAVAIAQVMDKSDRAKMYGLVEPLIRRTMSGRADYSEIIEQMIG